METNVAFLVLLFTAVLLSPFPFASPGMWNGDALAQGGQILSGPPNSAPQNGTQPEYAAPPFAAYGGANPGPNPVANATAVNLAHDELMDVRLEYLALEDRSRELNATIAAATAAVLEGLKKPEGAGLFGSPGASVSAQGFYDAVTAMRNDRIEQQTVQSEKQSLKNRFKISPHLYALFNSTGGNFTVYVNLVSNSSSAGLTVAETLTRHETTIVAVLSESRAREIAESDAVLSIRLPDAAVPSAGSFTSEGVAMSGANMLHDRGITGENITVAIIDFDFIPNDPVISPRVSYSALYRSCEDLSCGYPYVHHGSQVAHVVADMAPNASLELYAVNNNIGIIQSILHIIERGMADIITISLSVPTEGGRGITKNFRDGTGITAQYVDRARNSGILVTVATANDGNKHWGGKYAPSSVSPEILNLDSYQSVMEVNPNAAGLQKACISTTGSTRNILTWDEWNKDPVQNDYDLFVFSSDMRRIVSYSTEWQPIGGIKSLEVISLAAHGTKQCLVVASKSSSEDHNMHVYANRIINPYIRAGSLGTPADARGVFAVGAVNLNNELLPYSGEGPTDDGRTKPEACGYTEVISVGKSSSTSKRFTGTSAATPHIAGMAALLLDANPYLTPDDIQKSIENSAISHSLCGSGIMSLSIAAQLLPNVTVTGGANSYAKAGDFINVTMSSNNSIVSANVTILGRNASEINITNSIITASVPVEKGDAQGPADFEIRATDSLGNRIVATPQILSVPNVVVDTTRPVLSFSQALTSTRIAVTFSEDIDPSTVSHSDFNLSSTTISNINVIGSTVYLATSSFDASSLPATSLTGSVADLAGNEAPLASVSTIAAFGTQDATPPGFVSLNISGDNANPEYVRSDSNVTVVLKTDSNVYSHNATILNRVAQTALSASNTTVTASVIVRDGDPQGSVDFVLNAGDEYGNLLQVTRENLTSENVIVDTVPPIYTSAQTISDRLIEIVFSEEMSPDSVFRTKFVIDDVTLSGKIPLGKKINLDTELPNSSVTPTVRVSGSLSDLAGNNMTEPAFNITAADGVPPHITSARPINTSAIKVTFSERLDPSSVNNSSFSLLGGPSIKSVSVLSSGNEVVITTTIDFGTGDSPLVFIAGTVNDTSGNSALIYRGRLLQGSVDSLSTRFAATRTATDIIELSFTHDGKRALILNSSSFDAGAFSITNPSMSVRSWHPVPYYAYKNAITDYNTSLNFYDEGHLGASLAAADFDGDGTTDLAIGAPGINKDTGRMYIAYLDADASVTSTKELNLVASNSVTTNAIRLGTSLAAADFDGDGTPDLAVGALERGSNANKAYIAYLNSTGSATSFAEINATMTGGTNPDGFGASLAAADFDGDGTIDLAVGAPGNASTAGRAYIAYLNPAGSATSIAEINATTANGPAIYSTDYFGASLAAADFDGDGTIDLAVGAPGNKSASGKVHLVYMNSDGSVKGTLEATAPSATGFGRAVSSLNDTDGDGRDDLVASALSEHKGTVYILRPKSDGVTVSAEHRFDYGFGSSLAHVGRISDGTIVVAAGTPTSNMKGINRGTFVNTHFGEYLEIVTSQISDTGLTPNVTYNAAAGSNLTVNGAVLPDGSGAVASDAITPALTSAATANEFAVNVTFSESINGTTAAASDFLLDGTAPAEITVSGRVVTLITASAFPTDSTPSVSLTGEIRDLAGTAVPQTSVRAADKIRPAFFFVTTPNPDKIVVTFTEPINTSMLVPSSFAVDGVSIRSVTVGGGGLNLTMETDLFASSTTLRATVQLEDMSGNKLLFESAPVRVIHGRPAE